MKNKLFYPNLFFALILFVLYFIYSAILSPIYISLCSDVIYLESYLPYVLEFLLELCQLLIWVHLFSNMFFFIKKKNLTSYIVFTVFLTLARYFYTPVSAVTKGTALDLTEIIDQLIYFGADMLILGIVFILIFFGKRKEGNRFLRFGSIASAILISASKITTRIIFDIFYGAPESLSEIVIMILYYFSDVIYGIISYFLIYFVSKKLQNEKNSR